MQVSLFNGFADKNPKPITICEVVEIIRADQRLQVLTENHRRYRAMGDTARADAEKQHMPCYSVAVLFSGGKQQKHIVSYTGLSIVDLDHIPSERMAEVLTLVKADSHTLMAYTTISGEGVRVITRFALNTFNDNVNDNDNCLPDGKSTSTLSSSLYKTAFLTVNEYYKRLTGCDYDEKCKNATRISGMAHDPEVYYNPDAVAIIVDMTKKSVGRPRKRVEGLELRVEGKGKSARPLTPQLINQVLAKVEAQGIRYEAGSYNKYVSTACYEINRYGVPEEECREWAVNRFDDYNTPEVEAIVHSCYAQTDEHGTVKQPRAESRYASIKDIQDWLRSNDIRIRHNVITRKREISFYDDVKTNDNDNVNDNCHPAGNTAEPKSSSSSSFSLIWKELEDKSVNSLYCRFCLDTGRQAKISDFFIIIESDFYPDYNPLREYLDSLPAWDGVTDHIDQLASTVHVTGCTQEMHNRFFKKWMVAMVAAWLDDGTTNHEILTYIGEQGKYKTSFMTHLLPPALDKYFAIKHFNHSMSKDDRLALTELALIDL